MSAGQAMRIVVVEDLPTQAADVELQLRDAFSGVEIDVLTCESDFRDSLPAMAAAPPSLFIIDLILRWTTPRIPMPARPPDAATPYRAGARCIRALLDRPETASVPVLIHSAVDPAGITELNGLPAHVMYARKGSDLASLVRSVLQPTTDVPSSRRVFIAHGHNAEIRKAAVELLRRLDLDPVVLVDEAAKGRTLVELLERNAKVDYAVILLTADDLGRAKTEARSQKRARQNVVFELGFFIGRLGRERVCSLYESGVEIPTDYEAVKYIQLDLAGTWKKRLGEELRAAKIPVDRKS